MAGAYKLLSLCDDALVAYLIGQGAGTSQNVLPSRKSIDKTLENGPITICKCGPARPQGNPYSGVYAVSAVVQVRALGISEHEAENQSDQPKQDDDAHIAATFDALHRFGDGAQDGSELAGLITAAAPPGLTIDNVEPVEIDRGFEAKGDGWVDLIHLLLIARPS